MIPNYDAPWEEGGFSVRIQTNSMGLRGKELQRKSPSKHRIIMLGDSMVFGWGANNDETIPAILERKLNQSERPYEVINAGVQGYGTDQSYKFYKKRLAHLKPDTLIFCLFMNDMNDNLFFPLYSVKNNQLVSLDVSDHPLYKLGELQKHIPALLKRTNAYAIYSTIQARKMPYEKLPSRNMNELNEWSKKKVLLQLADMKRMADKNGYSFLIVGLPYKAGQYSAAGIFSFIDKSPNQKFNFLDLSILPVWEDRKEVLFMKGVDPHTKIQGYRKIAELLSRHLLENQK